jgi:hypothetical protein
MLPKIKASGRFDNLDGQGVQPLVYEILHCIIHKPVAGHAAFAVKGGAGNTHPKMRAKALFIRAHVARVGGAFVQYVELGGCQLRLKLALNVGRADREGLR